MKRLSPPGQTGVIEADDEAAERLIAAGWSEAGRDQKTAQKAAQPDSGKARKH